MSEMPERKGSYTGPGPIGWLLCILLIPVMMMAQTYLTNRQIEDWATSRGYLESKEFGESVWYRDGIQHISYFYTGSYLYEVDGEIRRGFLLEFPTKVFGDPKESRKAHAHLFPGKEVEVTHGPTAEDGSFLQRIKTANARFAISAFPYAAGFFVLVLLIWVFFEKKGKGWTLAAILMCFVYFGADALDPDGILESDEIAERGDIILPYLKTLGSASPWSDEPSFDKLKVGMSFEEAIQHVGQPETFQVGAEDMELTFYVNRSPHTLKFTLTEDREALLKTITSK